MLGLSSICCHGNQTFNKCVTERQLSIQRKIRIIKTWTLLIYDWNLFFLSHRLFLRRSSDAWHWRHNKTNYSGQKYGRTNNNDNSNNKRVTGNWTASAEVILNVNTDSQGVRRMEKLGNQPREKQKCHVK